MSADIARLTPSERDALRLLSAGYDIKSAAQALDLTPNALNERLRGARRKLGTTSSREAARLLAQAEGRAPNFSGAREIGMGSNMARRPARQPLPERKSGAIRRWIPIVGVFAMATLIAILTLTLSGGRDAQPPAPTAAPRVVATSPAQGSEIGPGPFTLSVTFDRPMQPNNYSFVRVSPETFPDCDSMPTQSADGRTFSLRCRAQPGHRFEVWFNRPPYTAFMDATGGRAKPYRLLFASRAR